MNSLMPAPEPELNDALATTLLANLGAFQGFARRRLGDDQLAADAVQESLLRALKSEHSLSHDENLLAWFYRILRNVLTDLHRRRAVQTAAFLAEAKCLSSAIVWLNPMPQTRWAGTSAALVAAGPNVVMLPLDAAHLLHAVDILRGNK